jgi:hypothetical protein
MIKSLVLGVTLVVLAVTAILVRRHWLSTVELTPVNMPISMSVGHLNTGDFKIDVNYLYQIEMHFYSEHYPDPVLDCLVGMPSTANKCEETPSLVEVKWVLTNDGNVLKQGVTHEGSGYWADGLVRTLGNFKGEAGHRYRLDLDVVKDGSRLATANPRLIIHPYREFTNDWRATYYFVEPLALVCVGLGLLLIVCSFLLHRARLQESSSKSVR